MAEGIKDKVAIIGMGCTKFGELWDKSAEDLIVEAYKEALEDAGIQTKDIQAVWQGNEYDEVNIGDSAYPVSSSLASEPPNFSGQLDALLGCRSSYRVVIGNKGVVCTP